jgi:glycosyltransferase involved in cell wall biosynthesis
LGFFSTLMRVFYVKKAVADFLHCEEYISQTNSNTIMDIICFSHLRWNFVYQRPQHLFKRFAKQFRVFYVEEPLFDTDKSYLEKNLSKEGVWIIVPHLPTGLSDRAVNQDLENLIGDFLNFLHIKNYAFWYYTPMALAFTHAFHPQLIIYDCMDELSAFKNAPTLLKTLEASLFEKADMVFTGGYTLYEAKKNYHPAVYPFPSSIDRHHFEKARTTVLEPADQFFIPQPRIGFFGVVDERMDIDLLDRVAQLQPDWQFIIIGPVVKIDPSILPKHSNIHYLGSRTYDELPSYLSGWDVAMMPFAINESTRYISPTKTPEYLAGGKPVVSTPIADVVNPYGQSGLVYIARTAEDFIEGIQQELSMSDKQVWLKAVDAFLDKNSWDKTAEKMIYLINMSLDNKQHNRTTEKENEYV